MAIAALLLLSCLLVSPTSHAFYLPGVAPRDFQKRFSVSEQDDELQVKVNKLSSTKTQLPYDFYFLDYCKPSKIMNNAENLGEVLRGDRIENSIYVFKMRRDETCKVSCRTKLTAESAKNFKEKIDDEYRVNIVMYHKDPESEDSRIVGFEVIPSSIKHEYTDWDEKNPKVHTCTPSTKITPSSNTPQEVAADAYIVFSYDVTFQLETQDEAQEETGWKLVHGDVFRPPSNSGLLCVYVGTEWKKITLKTAFMFPGIVFGIFFMLNALIWGEKSSGAVPFGTMFALVFLWFGISVPLVFVGSYLGFKKPAIEDPVRTNKIPRQIPALAWYMQPAFSVLVGGILPFGAVFIELFFILTSIWLNQFYYIFGFLFIVFVILIVTCAEITVVLCYFQLCSEDYHWWWRAYLTAGSSALYLFAYSVFYFFTKLEITKDENSATKLTALVLAVSSSVFKTF
ncbi:eukaryotic initiation factor [Musa troglodytarum]|uniref:Transmembrane 9 superfamily member n=1 Tax=Musa troglodytarum TaxID=320322 RepID=A0A9E7IEJ8_9LILI|nr:eukaryotic initiation factor [Musa troglodytarum]